MKKTRPKPKIGPYQERIAQIIDEDKGYPKKQRHTAKRIYDRIKEMGYQGGYTQVKVAVREIKRYQKRVITRGPGRFLTATRLNFPPSFTVL